MSTMQYSYKELTDRTSKFLGTYGSSGPSGTDLTDAQAMVKSGYLIFLTAYDWTFRRRYASLSTESGLYIYEFPEDFAGLRTPFRFSSLTGYPPLKEVSDGTLLELRNFGENNAYPENFAVRAGKHSPETGQRYEVLFWPTPGTVYDLYYSYHMMPPMMSNDDDVHMGGAEYSECVLKFCLAAAEREQDEEAGVQTQEASALLGRCIDMDKLKEPRSVGRLSSLSAWDVARGTTRVSDITGFSDA